MPDFGTPVAQNVQGPQAGMQSLSSLMDLQQKQIGIQKQQQDLQTGAYTQQTAQGTAQSAQQQMAERKGMQKMMASGKDEQGNSIIDEKGEPITPAMSAAFLRNFPMTGQDAVQKIVKTQDDRLKLNDSVRGLGQNFKNDLAGVVGSSIGTKDDPAAISAKLDAYGQQNPEAGPAIARAKALVQHLSPQLPQEQRDKALLHLQQEFQPSATTASQQAPQMGTYTTPTGDQGYQQSNPLSAVPMGAVGPSVTTGIPKTTEVVDPNGGKRMVGGAQNVGPGQPGPQTALGPMDQGAQTMGQDIRKDANAGAATYTQSQFNNNQIIRLAKNPSTTTGAGGDLLAKLGGGYAAVKWTSDSSVNWDNLGHYMGLQAITQMKAAGLAGTDADKALSQSVTGDRTYTKDAVLSIARVNRALSEGSRLFNEGVERAAATGNGAAVVDFKNKWSSGANADSFLLYNAKRSKSSDPDGMKDVVKEMGGVDSPRYKAALQSIDVMRTLINGK